MADQALDAGGLGSFTVINGSVFGDGVSVSPNGLIAYIEQGAVINGYLISTGALVFTSAPFGGGPDGTAAILGGAFDGYLIVNSNNGVTAARIRSVQTGATEDLALQGVFIAIGHRPNTELFVGQLEMVNGYIVTRGGLEGMATATNVAGVFAA